MTTTENWNAPALLVDDITVVAAPAELPEATAAQLGESHTTLPPEDRGEIGPRRDLGQTTAEDRFNLWGALVAGMALALLLFGWFAPLTGEVGWAVVAFLSFLGIYALLVSLRADRRTVADRVMTVLFVSAGLVLFAALVFVFVFAFARGASAVGHLNFFGQTMEFAGPLDPLSKGGILHAIVGTLIQIAIALAITVPLGVATAVFLNEIGGRFARFVRTIADAMTALPSIVAGLFVYSAIIAFVTHQRSGFAASLAITVMMLPIVIRASDVVLRLVAGNLREASYALGSTRWRTVWHVVLPTARSGLVTAVILGTARGIGETSPVLLTSGVTAVLNVNPFSGPMISLPLQVFDFVKSPEPTMIARGFGTAVVLILLVLALFFAARILGGKAPGQQSAAGRRRTADGSRRDLLRIREREARAAAVRASAPDAVAPPVADAIAALVPDAPTASTPAAPAVSTPDAPAPTADATGDRTDPKDPTP